MESSEEKEAWGGVVEAWDPQFCASVEVGITWEEKPQAEDPKPHLLGTERGYRE